MERVSSIASDLNDFKETPEGKKVYNVRRVRKEFSFRL